MLVVKSNIVVGEAEGVEAYGEQKIRVQNLRLYADVIWPGRPPAASKLKIREWGERILIGNTDDTPRGIKYRGCILNSFYSTRVESGTVILVVDAVLSYEEARRWFKAPAQRVRELAFSTG